MILRAGLARVGSETETHTHLSRSLGQSFDSASPSLQAVARHVWLRRPSHKDAGTRAPAPSLVPPLCICFHRTPRHVLETCCCRQQYLITKSRCRRDEETRCDLALLVVLSVSYQAHVPSCTMQKWRTSAGVTSRCPAMHEPTRPLQPGTSMHAQ